MTMSLVLALALAASQESPPALSGSGWVNAKEISLDRLKGKVVALYFFEEG